MRIFETIKKKIHIKVEKKLHFLAFNNHKAWERLFDTRGRYLHWSGYWASLHGEMYDPVSGWSDAHPSYERSEYMEVHHGFF